MKNNTFTKLYFIPIYLSDSVSNIMLNSHLISFKDKIQLIAAIFIIYHDFLQLCFYWVSRSEQCH